MTTGTPCELYKLPNTPEIIPVRLGHMLDFNMILYLFLKKEIFPNAYIPYNIKNNPSIICINEVAIYCKIKTPTGIPNKLPNNNNNSTLIFISLSTKNIFTLATVHPVNH